MLGRESMCVIKPLHMESCSGRLGICHHIKTIILLQAQGELTRNHIVLGAVCSSLGQEAKTFVFLGGRGC